MTELLDRIDSFEKRLMRLTEQLVTATARISELEKENGTLLEETQKQQIELKQLRKKRVNPTQSLSKSKEVSKLVKDNLTTTVTNAELKQQLDEYIRSIDHVVAHLSALS